MGQTAIQSDGLAAGCITRSKLNTTLAASAVVAKVLNGVGIAAAKTGVDTGTGDVTLSVDQTFTPTWTGAHTFNQNIALATSTGVQLAFTYNGYNYVTASGAAATLQLQATGASGTINIAARGATILTAALGVQIGAPTGGDLGAGTLNLAGGMAGLYLNGTALQTLAPTWTGAHNFTPASAASPAITVTAATGQGVLVSNSATTSTAPALAATNSSSGTAFTAYNGGTGIAVTASAGSGAAISASNNGSTATLTAGNSGSGNAISATSSTGTAINASATSSTGTAINASGSSSTATLTASNSSSGNAISAGNSGSGNAIYASSTGSGTGNAIYASSTGSGTGNAIYASSSSGTAAVIGAVNTGSGSAVSASNNSTANAAITASNAGGAGSLAVSVTAGGVKYNGTGVQVGTPTGGDEGSGTINVASGYYVNGVNQFQTGTFTGTLVGLITSPIVSCSYAISGSMVTLTINKTNAPITGTSNSTSLSMTGLPAAMQPSTSYGAVPTLLGFYDNGVAASGTVFITAGSGTITFYKGSSGSSASWTGSGTKGISSPITISYNLN